MMYQMSFSILYVDDDTLRCLLIAMSLRFQFVALAVAVYNTILVECQGLFQTHGPGALPLVSRFLVVEVAWVALSLCTSLTVMVMIRTKY
jgi:hypothetical protein